MLVSTVDAAALLLVRRREFVSLARDVSKSISPNLFFDDMGDFIVVSRVVLCQVCSYEPFPQDGMN